ncbi:hypothetical protein [Breznakia pachnodae]|uniref:Uncharacterized protein n=1 Tax=Breznakia pachnodae TaxID=265178 RepID=A0ABU0E3T4_9FIRM|nr:hypothetical protein [Breznakia pachnodae]MDQ0361554.1 hypothetical protein [Breznakia pachnodae]
MKLKEIVELKKGNLSCCDVKIDSMYTFNIKFMDITDVDYPNCKQFLNYMINKLDVISITKYDDFVINLSQVLDNKEMISYAKKYFYTKEQYENDDDILKLLFSDIVKNLEYAIEERSESLLKMFEETDCESKQKLLQYDDKTDKVFRIIKYCTYQNELEIVAKSLDEAEEIASKLLRVGAYDDVMDVFDEVTDLKGIFDESDIVNKHSLCYFNREKQAFYLSDDEDINRNDEQDLSM